VYFYVLASLKNNLVTFIGRWRYNNFSNIRFVMKKITLKFCFPLVNNSYSAFTKTSINFSKL
jgi:hypothetical protein